MKILVLGGTGAIGKYLSEILNNMHHDVHVTTRSKYHCDNNISYIQGNAKDNDFLSDCLKKQKWDVIIDLMIYSTEEFDSRYEKLLSCTGQYIFMSSARVYANSINPIVENSKRLLDVSRDQNFLSIDEYAITKAHQENLLINSKNKNWTIIRPYITYSEQRLQLGTFEKEDWLYRALNNRPIIFCKDINDKVTTLSSGFDVSLAISHIVGNVNANGEIFHITSQENVKWSEILQTYLDVIEDYLGTRPNVILQDVEEFYKWQPARYQIEYDRLYDRKFDNSKISKYLKGYQFQKTLPGLAKCLCAFLENPKFKDINWRAEAAKDKLVNTRASIMEPHSVKQKTIYFINRNTPFNI